MAEGLRDNDHAGRLPGMLGGTLTPTRGLVYMGGFANPESRHAASASATGNGAP